MPNSHILARPGAPAAADLDELRGEIDRIDNALLALMERRLATAHAVAALKRDHASEWLNLRPNREAAVLDRLTDRAEAMPVETVRAIWRELIALNLQAQRRMEVVVHAGSRPTLVVSAARERFGGAAPIVVADTPEEALERALTHEAVAVIELSPLSAWWIALTEIPGLSIFEALRDADGVIVALAVGRIAPESLLPRERYLILAEETLAQRAAAGEAIRAIAMCGRLRLCLLDPEGGR
jgi:chorismate mutase/prephenate dehydratase